jgi:hypothetical protein
MRAKPTATRTIAKVAALTALALTITSVAGDFAWAKRRLPPGACVTPHRRVVANNSNCATNCNALGWCVNLACVNGNLTPLPLPCHSPEACPARAC